MSSRVLNPPLKKRTPPNCSVRMQVFRARFSKSKLNQGSDCPTRPFLLAIPYLKNFAKEAKTSYSHKSLLQSSDPCQSTQSSALCTQGRKSLNERYSYITKIQYHSLYEQKTQPKISQETWILMYLDFQNYVSIIWTALFNCLFFSVCVHALKYII